MSVTCKLMGGLGNQMFQAATTLAYAWDNNLDPVFPKTTDMNCTRKKSYVDTVLRKLNRPDKINGSFLLYKEPKYSYSELPVGGKNIYLHGYFQSWKYFDHHRSKIIEMFEPTEGIQQIVQKYDCDDAVSVHVRRGDYLHLQEHHYNLPLSYYEEALKKIPTKKMLVFSDDIEWCKKQSLFAGATFVEEEDFVSIYVMSKCKHHVIANSSFSWWGAYLSETDGVKIAPMNWFGPKGPKYVWEDLFFTGVKNLLLSFNDRIQI